MPDKSRYVYLYLPSAEDKARWGKLADEAGSRLNRAGIMTVAAFGGEDYSFEELVAELTSAYLCARNGIDNTLENSSAYIQHWLKP